MSLVGSLPLSVELLPSALFWSSRDLSFPTVGDPVVSIVVTADDRRRSALRCLNAIARQTTTTPYEVILVDHGRGVTSAMIQRRVRGARAIRSPSSDGEVGACNAGARLAKGRFLAFLEAGSVVTPGWLEAMLSVFDKRPDCGAVGPKLVRGGLLEEAGGIVWKDGSAWNVGRYADPRAPSFNYLRSVDYCSGVALMVRRDAWDRVGGYDRQYAPRLWEDADLCFALREVGLGVWYQPAAVARIGSRRPAGHHEGRGGDRRQAHNRGAFRTKWAARLVDQADFDLQNLFAARDRNRGAAILVFDHHVPTPDRDAGSLFMREFLATLTSLGHRVVFWPENLFPTALYTEVLQQLGIEVAYGHLSLPTYLASCKGNVAAAIAYRAGIAARFLPVAAPFVGAVGYVVCDLEHVREERRATVLGRRNGTVAALLAREARVVGLADCVAVHSPPEAAFVATHLGARRTFDLPLPTRSPPDGALPFAERRHLLFVGSAHPPNVDGVTHFALLVLPRVRALLGDVRLRVVGDVCQRVRQLTRLPGVDLVGVVDDLDQWLASARVFVSPLRYGAGLKGKIIMALGAGLPIVTTAMGAEGVGLVDQRSALIADDDEAFARAVARLHSDPSTWSTLSDQGRALAAGRYSEARFRGAVDAFVDELLAVAAERTGTERRAPVLRAEGGG